MIEREWTEEEFAAEIEEIRRELLAVRLLNFDPKLPKQNAPTSRLEH